MLSLRLFGEVELLRDGERLALPPSKKTRALLAYLAVTGRPHRRERLCALFWEIPDDPRGALRWSLSKLRPLVDEPGLSRIQASREAVSFERLGAEIDLLELRNGAAAGIDGLPTEELERLAGLCRGEFLEGLDFPNLHDFEAWCLAEREDARRLHAAVLTSLVARLKDRPAEALSHARALVRTDPLSESARLGLLGLLLAAGRRSEAEQHFASAMRLFRELGEEVAAGLERAWRKLREAPEAMNARAAAGPTAVAEPSSGRAAGTLDPGPLIGRDEEWRRLRAVLEKVAAQGRPRVVLLTGEPGLGKSRLLDELARWVEGQGGRSFAGCAYEAERERPYGPWAEAIGELPIPGPGMAEGLSAASPGPGRPADAAAMRDRLHAAFAERLALPAQRGGPVLLTLDDMHWCDDASAGLLHSVLRSSRNRPLMVVLAARGGELPDNPAMMGALRSLRHDRLIEEIELAPLSVADTARLIQAIAPEIDASRVAAQSGGNPLFAIELARNLLDRPDELPRTLKEIVRDRLGRLPPEAADLLRWASVLGPGFAVERLAGVVALPMEELMAALETLERHALLREADGEATGSYIFAHELVHRAIYTDLSEPRRRLMHLKVARWLRDSGRGDEAVAADIAHHAALAGDAAMAAAACVASARRCLRLFANIEAEILARRGLHHAERLPEPERTKLTLELVEVEIMARRPAQPSAVMDRLEVLAERALDHGCLEHARLGFFLLSWLRWEGGLWSEAQRDTLRAELVSRSGDERERMRTMAETARCLALLERDLGQAEALLLEARSLSQRIGIEPDAIAHASGMLRLHEGRTDEAAALFRQARTIARRDGSRTSEFLALEHLVLLEMQRQRYVDAERLCAELRVIADKLREGSEAPVARALDAVCRAARGDPRAAADLEQALSDLRAADAKHRLAVTLLLAAEIDLRDGAADRARGRAEEALQAACLLDRPTEMALAHAMLARVVDGLGAASVAAPHREALRGLLKRRLSSHARRTADAVLATAAAPA